MPKTRGYSITKSFLATGDFSCTICMKYIPGLIPDRFKALSGLSMLSDERQSFPSEEITLISLIFSSLLIKNTVVAGLGITEIFTCEISSAKVPRSSLNLATSTLPLIDVDELPAE